MTNLRFRLERLEEERAARPKLNSEQMRELACRRLPLDPRRIYQPRWIRERLGIVDSAAEEVEWRLLGTNKPNTASECHSENLDAMVKA